MDFQLTDIWFWRSDTEQTLRQKKLRVFPKKAGQQPENQWNAILILWIQQFKLLQQLAKYVRCPFIILIFECT